MQLGTEDRKKLTILGVAGVGALAAAAYIYSELFPSTPAPVASAPVVVQPATRTSTPVSESSAAAASAPGTSRKVATTAASLDPTLHMSAMLTTESLQYRGTGRNIFSATAAPAEVRIPKALSSARPTLAPAAYTPPSGPPQPPPINLRFFGTATRPGQPARALLLRGEDVVLASVGDIVQRRYKILNINASSITVQDLSDEHQQTLPLITN